VRDEKEPDETRILKSLIWRPFWRDDMSRFDARIAQALGWSEEQVAGFSLHALRELLPEGKLKHDLTQHIQSGEYVRRALERR
jgi:hypothetical protein